MQTVTVAFPSSAEVLDVVFANGQLFQFDSTGAHRLASGAGAAGVALASPQPGLPASALPYVEVLDVLFANRNLYQFDPAGTFLLATGL